MPKPILRSHADTPALEPLRIRRIEVWVCRVPIPVPVATSFGAMRDRRSVFVRLEDGEGAHGFGEVWCNFPACGPEHRARLVIEELADLALGREIRAPSDLFEALTHVARVRAIQTGEPGPFAQAIAGLDVALWDLAARRAGVPVRRLLSGDAADAVPAYASGIHIEDARSVVAACRGEGFKAFKVKVGFDAERDIAAVNAVAGRLEQDERLLADANQAWDVEAALAFAQGVREAGLGWLEEPIPADAPEQDWLRLARAADIPIAAGENMAAVADFEAAIDAGWCAFVQPDIAKWGGFTGCRRVAAMALAAGRSYCPHFLGGGIGLKASAELLAAAGGPGLLEVDVNPNPLRDAFLGAESLGPDGVFVLGTAPGLGVEALPDAVREHVTLHEEAVQA